MSIKPTDVRTALAVALAVSSTGLLRAQSHEELGRMWTLEHPPLTYWQTEYDFSPDQAWMDKARMAALRFGDGCSSSFVSPNGLIMTNHHCVRDWVAQVTPAGKDWLADGFIAGARENEVKIPGLTVQQLISMKDVTDDVLAAVGADDDAATRAKKIADAQQAIQDAANEADPGHTHQLVSLFQGGRFSLYTYKIYEDIRLVAVPHLQAQKFGGDPDNFTYPRFSLDCGFVRAYEGDAPVDSSAHFFEFNTAGPEDGDLVFVVGNPGSTGRLNTVAQMEFMRDVQYPGILERIDALLEQARAQPSSPEATSRILSLENAQKAYRGYLDGLLNDEVMNVKREAEARIRANIAATPELADKFGTAFEDLEKLVAQKRDGSLSGRELAEKEQAATQQIGAAYFAVYGTDIPPDATFTLRISDGVVTGFPYNGTIAPWATSLYGLYARNAEFDGKDPFHLPEVFLDKEKMATLDMTTKVNFVATPDIIGGNSGSPILNSKLECVGLVFDGNIEMLGNRFVFTDEVARTVCVHNAYILEAMDKLYGAHELVAELREHGVQ